MKKSTIISYLLIILSLLLLLNCNKDIDFNPKTTITDDFESGSIGEIIKNSNTNWTLHLANDNDNSELPD
nr:hypothetical protein [Prolixibacteraceae bacterium]